MIGIYGGFLHVGVGYFLLIGLVILLNYDLMESNALKNFIVLIYTPFPILLFIYEDVITMQMIIYGLIHSIGNVLGAILAVFVALKKGARFIRHLMIVVICVMALHLFGVF
ncbi:hypothetical protein FACS1894201_11760 [Bacteroidia bacterium]|nr:hypothetical protein FACS1894201_11760 [Bacteroidia bacterium]